MRSRAACGARGWRSTWRPTAPTRWSRARVVRYDVLVLDRDLPGVHGDEVCRTVRDERPETGILMLTAAGTLEDVVEGLALGADDYLAKPFRFAELVARIRALGAALAAEPAAGARATATSSSIRRGGR